MAELDSGLNIIPEKPADEGLNIVPDNPVSTDPKVVDLRADQAHYAMGPDSPGKDTLFSTFMTGSDDVIRQNFAMSQAIKQRQAQAQKAYEVAQQAAQEGRQLTPSDIQNAFVPDPDETNPNLAIERVAAKKLTAETGADPAANDILTKRQVAQRVFENIAQKYKDQSWTDWGIDFAKMMIPGYTTFELHNRFPDVQTQSLFQGSNLADQIKNAYALPNDEFAQKLEQTVSQLGDSNLSLAVQFAQAFAQGQGTSSEIEGNIWTALDAATLGGTALKAGGKLLGASKVARDVVDASRIPLTEEGRQVLSGDVEAAAITKADKRLKNIGATDTSGANAQLPEDFGKNHYGLVDPTNYARDTGSLAQEPARRILDELSRNKSALEYSLETGQHVVRLSDNQAARAAATAVQRWKSANFQLWDHVAEINPVRANPEKWHEADKVEFLLGTKDATGFPSEAKAQSYARNWLGLKNGEFETVSRGKSNYIRVETPVNEEGTFNPTLVTDNNDPRNLQSAFLGMLSRVRNPDDVVSELTRAQAKTATYGYNATLDRMNQVAKSIGNLGKNESQRLRQVMDEAQIKPRTVVDPQTGKNVTVRGKFYDTFGEFEQAYMARHGIQPSDKEIQAYFSFRQLMNYDHYVKNLSLKRDYTRLGFEYKRLGFTVADKTGKKVPHETNYLIGRDLPSLPPRDGEPYTIAWNNPKTGKVEFQLSDRLFRKQREEIERLLKGGHRIIEPANKFDPAFRDVIDNRGAPVDYIVTPRVGQKPLDANLVPHNEGGHWIYPQKGVYVKQAQIHTDKFGRQVYSGDTTAFYVPKGKTGKAFVATMEKGRQAILRGASDQELDAILKDTPWDAEKFKKLFRYKKGDDAPFSLNNSFVLTDHGQRAIDVMQDAKVYDPVKSSHGVGAKINHSFTQERGERLVATINTGTEANPVFKFQPAPLLDTYQALQRGMAETAKNLWYEDYKHSALTEFIQKYADVLEGTKEQLLANPVKALRDAKWKTSSSNKALVAYGRAERQAILHMLSFQEEDYKWADYFKQKIVDSVLSDKQILSDPWKWTESRNPVAVLRSMVFHSVLGLFNWTQLPKQLQGLIYAATIDGSPTRAAQSYYMYWLARMRKLSGNSAANVQLGKMSKVLGIDEQTFKNAERAWLDSGMDGVEGVHSQMDYYMKPRLMRGANNLSRGLDAGLVFFREGNNAHLGVSFFTSYLRYLEENGLKKLNALDFQKIKDRADLYYGNMSRASNNALISDPALGTITQFTTYQTRLAEALLGKRLTAAEKARLIGMYSILYGIPTGALGSTLPIWPWRDQFKQWQLEENGGQDQVGAFETIMNDGLPAYLGQLLTGENYDVASAYGPNGFSFLRDALVDGEVWKALTGPQGSFINRVMTAFQPFEMAALSVWTGDNSRYPLKAQDFLKAARVISSVDRATQIYWIYHAGQFLTGSGKTILSDPDKSVPNTLAASLGIRPQELNNLFIKQRSVKEDAAEKGEISKLARDQFNLGMKAAGEGDEKLAEEYFTRAHTLMMGGNFTPFEMRNTAQQAFSENQELFDKINKDFMRVDPEKRWDAWVNNSGDR